MEALLLHQPYAEFVVRGRKTIVVKKWNTKFRGKFLVRASKIILEDECRKLNIDPNILTIGAIIGEAKLIGVKRYENKKEFQKDFYKHLGEDLQFREPCYGFILSNAKRLEPIECEGRSSWRVGWITRSK